MKKIILGLFIVTSFLFGKESNNDVNKRLTEQMMLGTIWMQQSGEYRALVYQAFNTAKLSFDNMKIKEGKVKAVVADLDETLIDNGKMAGWQIKNGVTYSSEAWHKWAQAKEAEAVPGAVEFSKYINDNGGEMFYISNRSQKEFDAIKENLIALGFPEVTEETLLLVKESSDKKGRREQIEKNGYEIVMLLGDNLNDFDSEVRGKNNNERSEYVDKIKDKYGVKYIVFPNPMYGDWEGGLYEGYWKKTPEEKLELRYKSLKIWNGE